MQPGRARTHRGQAVFDRQVAIAVAVPVHADAAPALVHDRTDESDHGRRAVRHGVADRVRDADPLRAGANRRRVQGPQRIGSARVVSSVTYITGRPSLTAKLTASSVRR